MAPLGAGKYRRADKMASETVKTVLAEEKKASDAYIAAAEKAEKIVADATARAQADIEAAQLKNEQRAAAKKAAAEKKAAEIIANALKESETDSAILTAKAKSARAKTTKAILEVIIPKK